MLTDDVKCEVVVPWQAVVPHPTTAAVPAALALGAREALGAALAELVPLLKERADVLADVGLELEDVLLREDVGDDLALAGVLDARARVEDAALDGHERVVEGGLERAGAVAVDDLERVGVRDGEVVRRDAHEGACMRAPRDASACEHSPEPTRAASKTCTHDGSGVAEGVVQEYSRGVASVVVRAHSRGCALFKFLGHERPTTPGGA